MPEYLQWSAVAQIINWKPIDAEYEKRKGWNHVQVGHYTRPDNGQRVWQPSHNGLAILPEQEDQTNAREYARAYYHTLKGPKWLSDWNGDTFELLVLDEET